MNIMSAPQDTPSLLWIIENQNKYEILKILSDVDQEDLKDHDHIGNTALHLVLLNQSLLEEDVIELLEAFLDRGIDVNTENQEGKTVIHFAVKRRMCNVVELLTRRKAEVGQLDRGISTWGQYRDRNQTCLQMAIEHEEDMSIIEMLVDNRLESMGKNLATDMFSELLEICSWWGESRTEYFLKTLQSLINIGADVNTRDKDGITPIYRAVHGKNQRAVDFLNSHGADFRASNGNGENLFHALAKKGLLDKPATDASREALFDLITSNGCCDVNARDSTYKTPLHWAARCANLAIARKLIDSGAEMNCKNKNRHTPLHQALYYGKSEKLVELLLEGGANANSKDIWGRRPLFFAAGYGKSNLVTILLKLGACVTVDKDAKSPLWEAIRCSHDHHVDEMLAYGADVNNIGVAFFEALCNNKLGSEKNRLLILQHWIKLKTAKLPCSEKYEIVYSSTVKSTMHRQCSEDCLKEIELMKNTFIDSSTTIYSFLHMDFGRRRSHMNSEELRQLVQSPELEKQFPNYSVVILASYRETVAWKKLLEPAKVAWLRVTGIRLPDECLELIFAHFRKEDMVNMIEFDEGA